MAYKRKYEPIRGNPRRATEQSTSTPERRKDTAPPRKRRVQVTPHDWDELEAMAARMGIPRSQVYNVALQALQEKVNG